MPDLQELHWTNEPKAERIRVTHLGYRRLIYSGQRVETHTGLEQLEDE